MASTYSDLKFELIGTGDQSGTWGTTTNDNIGTAIEQALVGLGNPVFTSDANLTISLSNTVALQTARALVLNATSSGSLTATRELVVPTIEKQYIVQNNTSGAQSITVKTSGGTGITVPNGRKAHLYVDGANVIQMFDFVDINGGTIDNAVIGGTTAVAGTFTTVNATTVDTTNLEVTNIKAKDGTASATIADSTGVMTVASSVLTTTDINGGTIDNTAVGSGTASSGAFTTLTATTPVGVASGGTGAATLTGVLKGNGTSAFTVATAGTDYVAPGTATTFTALQTFAGTSSNADLKTSNILETATVSATAATGTIAYDVTTQSVLYYTTNASGNFTVNFRGSSGTSLNTVMQTGESISATFLVTNGATAYYNSAVQVDGSSVTPKWQGGTAPTSGNASSIDSYTYVIIKTGSAAFTVLASQTKFA